MAFAVGLGHGALGGGSLDGPLSARVWLCHALAKGVSTRGMRARKAFRPCSAMGKPWIMASGGGAQVCVSTSHAASHCSSWATAPPPFQGAQPTKPLSP